METAHSTYFTATSPLVSVLFVPSLHSYYISRNFLFFSSIYIDTLAVLHVNVGLAHARPNNTSREARLRQASLLQSGTSCTVHDPATARRRRRFSERALTPVFY